MALVKRGSFRFGRLEYGGMTADPAWRLYKEVAPKFADERCNGSGPVRTLADMSDGEISALESTYKCKVLRPPVGPRAKTSPGARNRRSVPDPTGGHP